MAQLRILTAGESHGKGLIGIIEGMPANLPIDKDKIDKQLKRRQKGYGRGDRMKIESDKVEILSGLRFGKTLGSPIAVFIKNRDWENWKDRMSPWENPVRIPRPGHADFAGSIKYDQDDLRNILERASARETAMRVAIGSIVRQLLDEFGIWIGSHVIQIHRVTIEKTFLTMCNEMTGKIEKQIRTACAIAESSDLRCSDPKLEDSMKDVIDAAKEKGDTVGGIFELAGLNIPVGLGSHVAWDRRLDAQIAADLMGIPAIKAVEIGLGRENGKRMGSEVHDPLQKSDQQVITHTSNRAGGIEGGISNGEPVIVQATMKPIPTLTAALPSVDLLTGKSVAAHQERSDVCAVPAASVVAEAMLAITLGRAMCNRYGGDSLDQMRKHFDGDQAS